MDDQLLEALPTETSPLLPQNNALGSSPFIHPTLTRLRALRPSQITSADLYPIASRPRSPYTPSAETAFALIVLLELRVESLHKEATSQDVWERWSTDNINDSKSLENEAEERWSLFLREYRSADDIEDVLWSAFPFENEYSKKLRVIDYLIHPNAPSALLSHRIIEMSLRRTWKCGLYQNSASHSSTISKILENISALNTPRILHLIELFCHLAYLCLLANFLLFPPTRPIITTDLRHHGPREYLLLVFPLLSVVHTWSARTVPFLLTLAAFLSRLPSIPFPGDISFGVLLFAFFFHIYYLHLPWTPTPLFLSSFETTLPLSILILHAVTKIIVPVILFFLPVLSFTWILLSVSLADQIFVSDLASLNPGSPSPMESRMALLIFFGIILLTTMWSCFIIALQFPFTSNLSPWDRFSTPMGMDARRAFFQAVVSYSRPCTFPPPFNAISLIFIRIPFAGLRLLAVPPSSWLFKSLSITEMTIWAFTVGPIAAVVSIILQILRC